MTTMRPEIPVPPTAAAGLPLARGYPVPWFVTWIDGVPDFRVTTPEKQLRAHRLGLCWICGQVIGSRRRAFVIGPMCAVNRISGEPSSHVDCADWAARACPFLTRPYMRRRSNDLPEAASFAGSALTRNPGAALVWITRRHELTTDDSGSTLLFRVGDPESVRWYCEGRVATRDEVMASIDSGMPTLRGLAEEDGGRAPAQLEAMYQAALPLVPA